MLLITSILLLVFAPALYNFLWKAIQPDEMLGIWQRVIDWVYGKGWHKLSDFLGGCQVCFAHFIAWVGYVLWAILNYNQLGWLVYLLWMGVVTVMWYVNLASKLLLDILAEKAEYYKKKNES